MSSRPFDGLGVETPQADLDALRELANQIVHPGAHAVEVGSWAGRTARVLCRYFGRLYCVDTWQGSPGDVTGEIARMAGNGRIFRTFCENVQDRLFRDIFPCRGPSLGWAAVWPFKVPFVFIDADHDYEAVKADILAWRPHVSPGGIMVMHDYGVFDGVTRAVDELIPANRLNRSGFCLAWTRIE